MLDKISGTLDVETTKTGLVLNSKIGCNWTLELTKKQAKELIQELMDLVENIKESNECRILGE